ncbi:hypothetical protein SFC65_19765 [Priestia filamentosa]|uniref:hypothetical protein n=1 Tax=Priestia filamentosa TaxID=1402861 RepID=UPI0039819E82
MTTTLREITKQQTEIFYSNPSFFAYGWLSSTENGTKEITFYPKENVFGLEKEKSERTEMSIKANRIYFADYILLKVAIDNIDIDIENGEFNVSDFYTLEELNEISLPVCYAGEEVSSKESICGNCYASTADTFGAERGSFSYKMYFFYVEDFDKFVTITHTYLDI